MAIPEHSKCVKLNKQLRYDFHFGNWRKVRAARRRNGYLTSKFRIRAILNAERRMHDSFILSKYHYPSITYFNRLIRGPFYKKYGKYDD